MKVYGLIGFPLSHSWSSAYFTAKFNRSSLEDHEYRLFELQEPGELLQILSVHPEIAGLNITIPYKTSVIPLLNEMDFTAREVGAVNCIKIMKVSGNILLKGYNTDIAGFEESLLPWLNTSMRSALVLGNGGASKAVTFVLRKLGISYRQVSRKPSSAKLLGYDQLDESILRTTQIIINTTPVGMYPHTDEAPQIPYQFLNNQHLLFDLIYNPPESLFLRRGKAAGTSTINGLRMLEIQADHSWEIWNK